mmetsp:Transcript_30805/g.99320  ORF Transcript_30805/g.99320 Transcript_30805/m.99320 type:complete len:303 (+) Transcript_30805:107-1015(+)
MPLTSALRAGGARNGERVGAGTEDEERGGAWGDPFGQGEGSSGGELPAVPGLGRRRDLTGHRGLRRLRLREARRPEPDVGRIAARPLETRHPVGDVRPAPSPRRHQAPSPRHGLHQARRRLQKARGLLERPHLRDPERRLRRRRRRKIPGERRLRRVQQGRRLQETPEGRPRHRRQVRLRTRRHLDDPQIRPRPRRSLRPPKRRRRPRGPQKIRPRQLRLRPRQIRRHHLLLFSKQRKRPRQRQHPQETRPHPEKKTETLTSSSPSRRPTCSLHLSRAKNRKNRGRHKTPRLLALLYPMYFY